MKRSVVGFSSNHCIKCLKCLRACKMEAITIVEGKVRISNKECINCGECLKACTKLGLEARGSTLVDIANYDHTICLVPTCLLATQNSDEAIRRLIGAIKMLGFDEVISLSDYEGKVYKETLRYVLKSEDKGLIAPFCPVVNRLILTKYPSLIDKLIPIDYPANVAAKDLRKKYFDKKLGIFYLAECISKLGISKYPYGANSEIDHSLSIMDLFPLLNQNKDNEGIDFSLANLGIVSMASHLISEKYKDERILVASGNDTLEVLELAEFEKLNDFDLLYLFKCSSGCIGGELLFGNKFSAKRNILDLATRHTREYQKLEDLSLLDTIHEEIKETRSMKERIKHYNEVNKLLKDLPGYDCGACGYSTCMALADDIIKGEAKISYCKVLKEGK